MTGIPCPVCGREGAPFPAEAVTLCEECGGAVHRKDSRILLVAASGFRTFCSPGCLRRYQARGGWRGTEHTSD